MARATFSTLAMTMSDFAVVGSLRLANICSLNVDPDGVLSNLRGHLENQYPEYVDHYQVLGIESIRSIPAESGFSSTTGCHLGYYLFCPLFELLLVHGEYLISFQPCGLKSPPSFPHPLPKEHAL
ncbi:hypothetical protein G5I_10519 [Acromyrmex echinatior]|uniref:Uncharacterized protein n=1 Tax=Acromyrmex echinatior TaxID=103372 RepID=F4WX28_ACREC|nr:hypothetical protein G5I_10519 [Acromyrmex echinatior]